ncbi:hypothetical protein Pmar_PMAR009985 [Perkinsus marinus ATCC 50983]|uniref:Uncharacterized protein n=1 Tax=Perkinsus marinus (strain ATCC 50983 / TXsc) TaxID=423536 RepID=C5L2S8_PERM5|nr:hypothetical protein Pmar_PMAR009985 [Perkinsus marinus ATCC 50983]EER08993.1 hypothetical protein Pmar_PMAR009985 [Perkinsus marinus ATCC 50983]|eukprot:XP_002777177.1 hypothetical protein Pmar_PMAR009985 [Perkinsus marinus ATCC 50983]
MLLMNDDISLSPLVVYFTNFNDRIFYHYLCSWFIFDLLACLPLIATTVPDFNTVFGCSSGGFLNAKLAS